ncbi:hypothetical protein RvY_05839 [Ramazzottius varieornatus]|uniref:Uncharacterized protein n=1 Tax=Ramazzottius varieornatus TaxID=947166 RepID=A0A1D1UZF8_RAMVA|nr:hypothetical protein RvY_05839 [Ramazzottius varieornatus]
MSQAVLELCTENKDKEKVQLDRALREAEVRPEEWTAEKTALEKLVVQSFGERDHLSNMLIELQNLNRFHKNNHESDKQEWQRLTERIDDMTYSIQSSMGCSNAYLPTDHVQRLQIFERYLILSEIVEEKLKKIYGPQLIEHHAKPLRGRPKNYPLEKLTI